MVEFKEFKIADLFTKRTVKGFSKVKEKFRYTKDGYHVFGQNIKYQFPQKVLLDSKFLFEVNPNKPIIGYASSTGSVGMISESFYRSGNNGAFQALIPKFDNYNYRHILYLLACLRKLFSSKNYTTNINNVPEWVVVLPIASSTGKIDFQYMEDQVKVLEQDRVKALDNYLTVYLTVTGLDDYKLTKNDKNILSTLPRTKSFTIGELMVGQTGDVDIQNKDISDQGEWFINSGVTNRGIKGKTTRKAKIFPGNTITIDFFGNANYRSEPYKLATHNHVFSYSGDVIKNEKVGLYLVSTMRFLTSKYSYSNMATRKSLKDEILELPIDAQGNIDFKYMEYYIKAIQKLTIKNVVKYKDEVIDKTKEIIN